MNKTLRRFEKTMEEILKLREVTTTNLLKPIGEGKWSIREIVGHLYYWDKYNLEKMVPEMAPGANLPQFPDHDEHNKEAILYLKDRTVDSIIQDFIHTRKELIEKINSLGSDATFTIGGGKRQFSGETFIKMFLKHDAHHLKQINETISQK